MSDELTIFLVTLVILLLINPIIQLIQCIWEFFVKFCISKPVDLRNKYGDWAAITGCTDGIGKEYAKELAKRNMNLILISRSIEKLNKTKDEIQATNPTICIKIIQADFSKGKEELRNIKNEIKEIPVAILVNNVGALTEYPMYLGEIEEDDLWRIINLNISTTTLMTRMVIEDMKKRGKGAIVNVGSAASLQPIPLMSVYSASKVFVTFFSDAIRGEYSKYGVTVQCLSPYYINTKMVGFSDRFQNNPFVPDAAKYAKNAIETLGKFNSTTGFWIHDLVNFFALISPVWLRTKVGFLVNRVTRRDYLAKQHKEVYE